MLKTTIFCSILAAILVLALGCDEVTDEEDAAAAQALADSAIGVFEGELASFIDSVEAGEIDSPYEIDFTTSNALFKEALVQDYYNLDANFGAGLTELLIFTQDPDFKAVFDAWEAFADSGSIFVAGELNKGRSPLSIFQPGGGAAGSFQLLNNREVAATFLSMPKMAVSDPPTIGDIQDLVESLFIPTLSYIAARLDILDDSTDFTFTITSAMQGGGGETAKDLDLTEIYLLETGVNLLLAFSNAAVAYNVGPNAYDSAAVISWLSQGSGLLTLRSGGATRMGNAKDLLFTAADKLDAAANFLEADTDTANDIIKLRVGEVTAADLQELRDSTQAFRDMFDSGISFTEDWDDSLETADEELTFDFDVLFTNPITDFKSILPVYTVTVGRDTSYDYQWVEDSILVNVVFNLPSGLGLAGGYSFWAHYEYWDDWDIAEVYINHNFPVDITSLFSVADSLMDHFMAQGKIRHFSIDLQWDGQLVEGDNTISFNIYYGVEQGVPDFLYYTAIITFEADVAADWTFQTANLNGLIPQFTSDAELKRILGFKDEYFEKELIIPFDMGGGFDKAIPLDGLGRRSLLVPWAFVK